MKDIIQEKFGNRVRIRVCGLCFHDDKLLMVKHIGLGRDFLWAPPGGGLEFGEKATERLKKEFFEESNLEIEPGQFLFACEYMADPLHAIELFFEVKPKDLAKLKTGYDPEMEGPDQLIKEVAFISEDTLAAIHPENLHGIFKICPEIVSLRQLRGYYSL